MGSEKLAIGDIAKIPVIMGEKDVLKTLQLQSVDQNVYLSF
jgi:hypothetical protein